MVVVTVMMVMISGWPDAHAHPYWKTFESFSIAAER
jgi:hypothetical protein